jgi:hypothetical protein
VLGSVLPKPTLAGIPGTRSHSRRFVLRPCLCINGRIITFRSPEHLDLWLPIILKGAQ